MGSNSRHSSFTRSFMPFEYDRFGLDMRVKSYELDGKRKTDSIDSQRQYIDISRQKEWEQLKLNLTLTLPETTLEAVLPKREWSTPPVRLIVVWECGNTFWREFSEVSEYPEPGEYSCSIEIPLGNVRNKLVMHPYLVRNEDGVNRHEEFAQKKGSKLASSRGWEISLDENDEYIGGYLDIQYKSFEKWERSEIRANQLYHLDVNKGPEPVLWLNGDHGSIKEVMDSTGTSGKPPRIRDVIFDIMIHGVWTKLFLNAATEVNEQGETLYDWQQAVLEMLIPMMYPKTSMEAALSDIRQKIQEGENPSQVIGRLNSVLQTDIDHRDLQNHLTKLIEEVDS